MKAKKRGPYLKAITLFRNGVQVSFTSNEEEYQCVQVIAGDAYQYVFFSKCRERVANKQKKFEKELKAGSKRLKKVLKGKDPGHHIAPEGYIVVR